MALIPWSICQFHGQFVGKNHAILDGNQKQYPCNYISHTNTQSDVSRILLSSVAIFHGANITVMAGNPQIPSVAVELLYARLIVLAIFPPQPHQSDVTLIVIDGLPIFYLQSGVRCPI